MEIDFKKNSDTTSLDTACHYFRQICLLIGMLIGNLLFKGSFAQTIQFYEHESYETKKGMHLAVALTGCKRLCEYEGSKLGLKKSLWWYYCWQKLPPPTINQYPGFEINGSDILLINGVYFPIGGINSSSSSLSSNSSFNLTSSSSLSSNSSFISISSSSNSDIPIVDPLIGEVGTQPLFIPNNLTIDVKQNPDRIILTPVVGLPQIILGIPTPDIIVMPCSCGSLIFTGVDINEELFAFSIDKNGVITPGSHSCNGVIIQPVVSINIPTDDIDIPITDTNYIRNKIINIINELITKIGYPNAVIQTMTFLNLTINKYQSGILTIEINNKTFVLYQNSDFYIDKYSDESVAISFYNSYNNVKTVCLIKDNIATICEDIINATRLLSTTYSTPSELIFEYSTYDPITLERSRIVLDVKISYYSNQKCTIQQDENIIITKQDSKITAVFYENEKIVINGTTLKNEQFTTAAKEGLGDSKIIISRSTFIDSEELFNDLFWSITQPSDELFDFLNLYNDSIRHEYDRLYCVNHYETSDGLVLHDVCEESILILPFDEIKLSDVNSLARYTQSKTELEENNLIYKVYNQKLYFDFDDAKQCYLNLTNSNSEEKNAKKPYNNYIRLCDVWEKGDCDRSKLFTADYIIDNYDNINKHIKHQLIIKNTNYIIKYQLVLVLKYNGVPGIMKNDPTTYTMYAVDELPHVYDVTKSLLVKVPVLQLTKKLALSISESDRIFYDLYPTYNHYVNSLIVQENLSPTKAIPITSSNVCKYYILMGDINRRTISAIGSGRVCNRGEEPENIYPEPPLVCDVYLAVYKVEKLCTTQGLNYTSTNTELRTWKYIYEDVTKPVMTTGRFTSSAYTKHAEMYGFKISRVKRGVYKHLCEVENELPIVAKTYVGYIHSSNSLLLAMQMYLEQYGLHKEYLLCDFLPFLFYIDIAVVRIINYFTKNEDKQFEFVRNKKVYLSLDENREYVINIDGKLYDVKIKNDNQFETIYNDEILRINRITPAFDSVEKLSEHRTEINNTDYDYLLKIKNQMLCNSNFKIKQKTSNIEHISIMFPHENIGMHLMTTIYYGYDSNGNYIYTKDSSKLLTCLGSYELWDPTDGIAHIILITKHVYDDDPKAPINKYSTIGSYSPGKLELFPDASLEFNSAMFFLNKTIRDSLSAFEFHKPDIVFNKTINNNGTTLTALNIGLIAAPGDYNTIYASFNFEQSLFYLECNDDDLKLREDVSGVKYRIHLLKLDENGQLIKASLQIYRILLPFRKLVRLVYKNFHTISLGSEAEKIEYKVYIISESYYK